MPPSSTRPIFLTARWQYLAMINYVVDPEILEPLVPRGCELDLWQGQAYVSLVGFRFLDTKLKGLPIPFHRDFDEINLRFYIRRKDHENETNAEWKRAVAFIKEIVPKFAIAFTARTFYNEPYIAIPTRHTINLGPENENTGNAEAGHQQTGKLQVKYEWKYRGRWNHLSVQPTGVAQPMREGSDEQFIAEHYWGYTAQKDGGTIEYQVTHPAWRVWSCVDSKIDVDVAELYGERFVAPLSQTPSSVFLAEGSEISVSNGRRIDLTSI
jgi:uncharacterized protein YqjF (DUF2071 family)